MFRLTIGEWESIRSQNVTASLQKRNISALPYAFTEQGLAMMSGILNSEKAINVNIAIMRAFVLISLAEGNERRLLREILSYNQVKNAHILFGEWDIMAEVECADAEELGSFVMDRLRSRSDVKLTSSLIVAGH